MSASDAFFLGVFLVAAGFLAFGVNGSGFIFSSRFKFSSSLESFAMDDYISDEMPLEYLAAMGAVTLNFAALETVLDFTIAAIFNGLDRMGEKEIPRSLDNKLGFLRKAFKHPHLASIQIDGGKILDEIHNIKEDRHDIVHSALAGRGMEKIRVRYTPLMHKTEIKPAPTQKQVERLALKIRGLHESGLSVAIKVFNLIRPENPMNNPFR